MHAAPKEWVGSGFFREESHLFGGFGRLSRVRIDGSEAAGRGVEAKTPE